MTRSVHNLVQRLRELPGACRGACCATRCSPGHGCGSPRYQSVLGGRTTVLARRVLHREIHFPGWRAVRRPPFSAVQSEECLSPRSHASTLSRVVLGCPLVLQGFLPCPETVQHALEVPRATPTGARSATGNLTVVLPEAPRRVDGGADVRPTGRLDPVHEELWRGEGHVAVSLLLHQVLFRSSGLSALPTATVRVRGALCKERAWGRAISKQDRTTTSISAITPPHMQPEQDANARNNTAANAGRFC